MHPAPSLIEAPPLREEPRQGQQQPMSAGSPGRDQRQGSSSPSTPPVRKDTTSSTSTAATSGSTATATTVDTASSETPRSATDSTSPTFPSQAVFSVNDGSDSTSIRRTSRRRTGPLSASQREKAALIRKLGACNDCRRRRVACHPNHHNMSWEDAVRKYKSHSPTQEYALLAGRPLSSGHSALLPFTQDPQEMEIDSTPTQYRQQPLPNHRHSPTRVKSQPQPLPPPSTGRLSIGSEGRLRTPLPSGRSLEKLASAVLPGIESLSGDLQSATSHIINDANPHRSRYDAVHVVLLVWSNEPEHEVRVAIDDLATLLEKKYNYTVDIVSIPVETQSPYRWLLQAVTNFVNNRDLRDTLKILYYAGCTYLDGEREMVLSSSMHTDSPTIRWSGIQQVLEDATSDTLVLMDAAYYPCSRLARQEGVLELIAASAGENPGRWLGRASFTRALTQELQTRMSQKFRGPLSALSAAELHARLMSNYPRMIRDRDPEKEQIMSFPSPQHIQISANARLPSILLAPCRKPLPTSPESQSPGTQLHLTVRLADGGLDKTGWMEWMRLLPDGVLDVKCDSPFRNSFR